MNGTSFDTAPAIAQAKSAACSCVVPDASGTKTWMPRLPEVFGTDGSFRFSSSPRITIAASMACSIPLPLARRLRHGGQLQFLDHPAHHDRCLDVFLIPLPLRRMEAEAQPVGLDPSK